MRARSSCTNVEMSSEGLRERCGTRCVRSAQHSSWQRLGSRGWPALQLGWPGAGQPRMSALTSHAPDQEHTSLAAASAGLADVPFSTTGVGSGSVTCTAVLCVAPAYNPSLRAFRDVCECDKYNLLNVKQAKSLAEIKNPPAVVQPAGGGQLMRLPLASQSLPDAGLPTPSGMPDKLGVTMPVCVVKHQ